MTNHLLALCLVVALGASALGIAALGVVWTGLPLGWRVGNGVSAAGFAILAWMVWRLAG